MDFKDEEKQKVPQEESKSLRQLMKSLHFSGKVIIGSVLLGFGLVLVGAILLVIATGSQKAPPLRMTPNEKGNTLVYVGPGVMGIGGFLIVVGTAMCLIETTGLRGRRPTEAPLLPNDENADPSSELLESASRNRSNPSERLGSSINRTSTDMSKGSEVLNSQGAHETSLEVEVHANEPSNQLSASPVQDLSSTLTASIYVDAEDVIGFENEQRDDSNEFKTPPETHFPNSNLLDFQKDNQGSDLAEIRTPEVNLLDPLLHSQTDQQINYPNQSETSLAVNSQKSRTSGMSAEQPREDITQEDTSGNQPDASVTQPNQLEEDLIQMKASSEVNVEESETPRSEISQFGYDSTSLETSEPNVGINYSQDATAQLKSQSVFEVQNLKTLDPQEDQQGNNLTQVNVSLDAGLLHTGNSDSPKGDHAVATRETFPVN